MQINRSDNTHVCLPPFPAAVRYLALKQLKRIEAEFWLRDLEGAAQDGAAFVLHEKEGAVGIAFCELLEDAEEADGCEEEARGIGR